MNTAFKISVENGLIALKENQKEFISVFTHGTLEVEIYKPEIVDKQQPHERDEAYIIISGEGKFYKDGEVVEFVAGDFLFVEAGKEHRFFDFSEDFSTWVIFYGPKRGEK
ncbi:cupin domain-containing protein [Niabella ginsengisoli]|uniref:Cupin domain-containing protein n=1 Tax=Niabella ginsengisoli TaxID=522298 RepID=A0ABS9SJA8_9BACT|nr:cupin domain-containing protein [Niabella ginsengisoli]MCH5598462.1 cupin domain-containing protein [Niabella ginsengisoli]